MTPHHIAAIYCSGDLPFRPRAIGRLFAIRKALANPVRALQIAECMNVPTRQRFALDCESYAQSEVAWLYHELWTRRP